MSGSELLISTIVRLKSLNATVVRGSDRTNSLYLLSQLLYPLMNESRSLTVLTLLSFARMVRSSFPASVFGYVLSQRIPSCWIWYKHRWSFTSGHTSFIARIMERSPSVVMNKGFNPWCFRLMNQGYASLKDSFSTYRCATIFWSFELMRFNRQPSL